MGLVLLQQLDHHAVCGLGVDERYEPVDALSRGLVDQTDTLCAELLQGACDVGDGEADVVAAFASSCQKAGSAALFIGRREEFDSVDAGVKECDFNSVVGRVEPFEEAEAEDAAVGGEGFVEVPDNDADVVDLGVGQCY